MAKKRSYSKKKYFWDSIQIGSIPSVRALLAEVVPHLKTSQRFRMAEQGDKRKVTQETIANACFIWLHDLYHEGGGLGAVEEQLVGPMRTLERLVREDERIRAREEAEEARRQAEEARRQVEEAQAAQEAEATAAAQAIENARDTAEPAGENPGEGGKPGVEKPARGKPRPIIRDFDPFT